MRGCIRRIALVRYERATGGKKNSGEEERTTVRLIEKARRRKREGESRERGRAKFLIPCRGKNRHSV